MKRSVFLSFGLISLNLVVGFFLLMFFQKEFWEFWDGIKQGFPNLIIGVVGFYFSAYFLSQWAEKWIRENLRYAIPIGILVFSFIFGIGILVGFSAIIQGIIFPLIISVIPTGSFWGYLMKMDFQAKV